MKEIICLNIGQAGIQLGNACWELFCLQHGVLPNGAEFLGDHSQNNAFSTFFYENRTGKISPRSIYVDLEPTVIDEMRSGMYRDFFNPETLISGKSDAVTFARGYYTAGKQIVDIALERIRKVVESCQQIQGFLVFSSVAGGTGSGLTSLLLERLNTEYEKKSKVGFQIYPSPQLSTLCVEPYNAVLAKHRLLEGLDVNLVLQNVALYQLCKKNFHIDTPTYRNINQLVAQVISSITASLRFEGALNQSLHQFKTNLVPFQRFSSLICSYSPMLPVQQQNTGQLTASQITNQLFDPAYFMVQCDTLKSKYLACCIGYRGDIVPKDVGAAICTIKTKRTIQFVDWCPTGFKCGITYQQPVVVPGGHLARVQRSGYILANSIGITQIYQKIEQQFDRMYSKKAFVHWYLSEGMDEGQFSQAREDMAVLQKDYEEAGKDSPEQEEVSQG